jgi:hypothetical protein
VNTGRPGKVSTLSIVSFRFIVLVQIDAGDAHFSYIYCNARKNESF